MSRLVTRPVKAFSMIELMIVVVIIGILATLGIVQLSGPKEQALEKEAKANLKLIAAAEKIYRMEAGGYVAAADEAAINDMLRLMLPSSASKNWEYKVISSSGSDFNATATRTRGTNIRTYSITQSQEEPE